MFNKRKKYFVSFYCELDGKESKFGTSITTTNFKINREENLSKIRESIRNEIENTTRRKYNFLCIQNWKKLK